MTKIIQVRPTVREDITAIEQVLDTIELFPAEMLEEMIHDYLTNKETEHIWLTACHDTKPVAVAYCAPEMLTNGTYNLYAIGVMSDKQGKGIGSQMISYLELLLKSRGHRLLLVDTSGTSQYDKTRAFYYKLGYKQEAVIKDFWAEGDDKVTFTKKLQ